jgi:hypothetical protein
VGVLRSGLELLSEALGFGWRRAFTLPSWRLSYSLCASSLSFGHPQRSVGVGVSLGVSSLLLLFFWVPADTLCHFFSAVRPPACYHWGIGIFGLCWTSLAGPWAFLFRYLNPGSRSFQVLLSLLLCASPLSAVNRRQLLGPAQLGSVSQLCPVRGPRQCDLKVDDVCTPRPVMFGCDRILKGAFPTASKVSVSSTCRRHR